MDVHVADPHWGHWIILYFYVGGIAAGAYALATLARLFGGEEDRRATRAANYLAFPAVCVCGLFLVIDLDRPERFWHMLIQSETFRPMFKWWSPMSVGSWGLSAFGAFSAVSFAEVLVDDGWLRRRRWAAPLGLLARPWFGKAFALGALVSAFFLGSYTGVLLSASNQPVWANSTWIGAVFLASAVSTGVAAVVLIDRWRLPDVSDEAVERLERADGLAIVLELALLTAFALSLRGVAGLAFMRWPGMLIPLFVVPVGLMLPLLLRQARGARGAVDSALLVLLGGFVLRLAVVGMPASLLLRPH